MSYSPSYSHITAPVFTKNVLNPQSGLLKNSTAWSYKLGVLFFLTTADQNSRAALYVTAAPSDGG